VVLLFNKLMMIDDLQCYYLLLQTLSLHKVFKCSHVTPKEYML